MSLLPNDACGTATSVAPSQNGPESRQGNSDLPTSHLAETRLPVLDGLRGVAVLMVLVFHYRQGMLPLGRSWLARSFRVLDMGQTGVDLFFVLSGFLITGILLNAKGSPHFLRNFYMRRVLRILPLYYLVVIGCLVAGWVASQPRYSFANMWWYLVYLQNVGTTFWPRSIGGPGHFWSLGVEEHFYLIWPFLILTCAEGRLPWVLLLLIGGAIACRVVLLLTGYDVFTFSLCRMDALALGALLAVFMRRREWAAPTARICRWGLMSLTLLLIVLYLLTSGEAFFAMQVIKYTLVALGYTFLIGAIVGPQKVAWLERKLNIRSLRWCGKYSYSMYVFHPFIFGVIMTHMRRSWTRAPDHAAMFMACEFALCIAGTCLAGWLSWHLFEKRFLEFKRFFEYGH
jgi:peptidoglycan/LPS O-acetylase OafA/YrhL